MRILSTLLFLAATVGPTQGAVLLYNHNATFDLANAALDDLGLAYTQANASNFNTLLTGSTWDLVVLDLPSNLPDGGFASLISYIAGGGKALMSFWALQSHADLAAAFEVQQVSSFFDTPAVSFWDPDHPIFDGVAPLSTWGDNWSDDGDRLDPLGAAVALAGFATDPTTGEAAIVLGNNGMTLYNGFIWDNFSDQVNGRLLIANQIDFLLSQSSTTAIPEPSTYAMLGSGLLVVAVGARRRRTVHK